MQKEKKKKTPVGKKNKQEHKTRAYRRKGWQFRTRVIGGKNTSIRSIHVNFSSHATKRIIMFHIQRLGNKTNYWVVIHCRIQRKSFFIGNENRISFRQHKLNFTTKWNILLVPHPTGRNKLFSSDSLFLRSQLPFASSPLLYHHFCTSKTA